MMAHSQNWRPLHVALAWMLSRDEAFCTAIAADADARERTFCAAARLEQAMISAGCFLPTPQAVACVRNSEGVTAEIGRYVANPDYLGRFSALALEYESDGWRHFTPTLRALPHDWVSECGVVTLSDYLFGRLHDAFSVLVGRIADGHILARGVAVVSSKREPPAEMPAASASPEMWLDFETGNVWEGPKSDREPQPRHWRNVTISWTDLLAHFEPPAQQLRDILFDRIRDRTISPARGEAEATRLGLAPLNPKPDPIVFDPMMLDDWTFAMSIAWIASGDLDLVRTYWDDYRSEWHEWIELTTPESLADGTSRPKRTMHLMPVRPASGNYYDLQIAATLGLQGFRTPPPDAKAELWRQLRAGNLIADGIDVATGKRDAINGREFQDLEIVADTHGEDRLVSTATPMARLEAVYLKPRLRRLDVMELWQPTWIVEDRVTRRAKAQELQQKQKPELQLKASFKKIKAAIEAEEVATGKPFPVLRPVERDKRLIERMLAQGLKDQEIPRERTFRAYFNEGPGKPAKSG